MSYGVQFINNNNVVTLDSEYARLMVISSGRYLPNQDGGMGSVTTFPVAVTSQEPPLVFVRPDTVNAIAGMCQVRIIGSAGNWTGFYMRAYNTSISNLNGRYFVAAFAAQAIAQYGVRMWGASGQLLFDSGTPSANFTRAFQNWSYVKNDLTDQGLTRIYYSVPFNFPQDEFLLLNTFGMNMTSGSGIPRNLYCWWDFPNNALYAITVAATNPTAFFLPAVFAKMTA
ncbi:hypothetical protein T3A99_12565 [Pseudomonas sp. N-137]|uniref:hypothetical protein n=1 Tax=Pseudomonas sp. N-137 TaxID=3108452 RepID=UPI002ADEF6AF|nr:hypothetical protein [Pseudomonas sp. N-137]MEA1029400.1 hypothetical protein [Pseudomonas sp. N-137]